MNTIIQHGGHTLTCTAYNCYSVQVFSADSPKEIQHFQVWSREVASVGTRNLCAAGIAQGKEMFGDLDKTFGVGGKRF